MKTNISMSALEATTQYVETISGKIAYRTIGEGKEIVLFNRFRGTLDTWDPAFIDELAASFRVIIFDYPGIGKSDGELPLDVPGVVQSVKSFTDALELNKFFVGGWSYGGVMAQAFTVAYPVHVSKLLVIGSNPPGTNPTAPEQIFFDIALKPVNDLADEKIAFFEPASNLSVAAAEASHRRIASRTNDLDTPVSPEIFDRYFKGGMDARLDSYNNREKLLNTDIPVLVVMGDHDPSFPTENWFPFVKKAKTFQFIIVPQAGHAPQHQHPELVVSYIKAFFEAKLAY